MHLGAIEVEHRVILTLLDFKGVGGKGVSGGKRTGITKLTLDNLTLAFHGLHATDIHFLDNHQPHAFGIHFDFTTVIALNGTDVFIAVGEHHGHALLILRVHHG